MHHKCRGDAMLKTNIILIGPSGTGKTTLARLLGDALKAPFLDLDEIRWNYYQEMGYDHEYGEKLRAESGMEAIIAYWKPFEIHSVERMFQDYPSGYVMAFGAGQSVYEDPELTARVQQALAPYTVILLLPSPDVNESLPVLSARIRAGEPDLPDEFFPHIENMNRYFIVHPANATLANHTVYTSGKSPEETCDEILVLMKQ
jgi:hypothetical protein